MLHLKSLCLTLLMALGLCQLVQATDKQETDWLINGATYKANIITSSNSVTLTNGLVERSFRISPNLACYDFVNLANNQQLIRSIKPEARLTINGTSYLVGGLLGQKENAYLTTESLNELTNNPDAFQYKSYRVNDIKPKFEQQRKWWTPANMQHPTGKHIAFKFIHSDLKDIEVTIHYEIYDHLPLLSKWVEVKNSSDKSIHLNEVMHEILGMVEEESAVVGSPNDMLKQQGIYFETNYAFNNAMLYRLSDQTTHWKVDPTYTSQVNYDYNTPCLLEIYPKDVTDIEVTNKEVFTSSKTYELLFDSYDRERRGLAKRAMYRTVSPWIAHNPIFMHLVSQNDDDVYRAIDQCAETGYEALILSFGSHVSVETNTKENHDKWKKIAVYAHSKNIKIGAYSLFSSRRISEEMDVISPITGKTGNAFFGNAPCFGSEWGLQYAQAIIDFYSNTGFDILEMDGPYPGDICASTQHPGHKDAADSQWKQMQVQKYIFNTLHRMGIYINAPDWYFLDGTHKIGMGYREVNFALSREQQKILNRQNIFDGTWEKTPSMGWGFVPLTAYHGGGKDAVLEPLNDHLQDYKDLMTIYYGSGVQACYRGPRLYDTDRTKEVVKEVVKWYKEYRDIMNADIIHLRRPDGRDWDGIMHVSSQLKQKAFGLIYNPTDKPMERTITLPLYYTGLNKKAIVKMENQTKDIYKIDRDYNIELTIVIPAKSHRWFVVE